MVTNWLGDKMQNQVETVAGRLEYTQMSIFGAYASVYGVLPRAHHPLFSSKNGLCGYPGSIVINHETKKKKSLAKGGLLAKDGVRKAIWLCHDWYWMLCLADYRLSQTNMNRHNYD